MPTAKLIARSGSSSSSSSSNSSSVVDELVSSTTSVGGVIEKLIPPQQQNYKKIHGLKEQSAVAKKSKPDVKARKYVYICSHEGCTNVVKKGGVCVTHGAKVTKKRCSFRGCTNHVVKGGVCVTHGAKMKQCSHKGCTNQVVNGGVCTTHGATKGSGAAMRGAPIKLKREEFVLRMVRR
jgi:hypothetical protein